MNNAPGEPNGRLDPYEDEQHDDGARSDGRRAGQLYDPRGCRQAPGGGECHERQAGHVNDSLQQRRSEDLERAQALATRKQVGSNRFTQARRQHRIAEVADQQDRDHAPDRHMPRSGRYQALPSPRPQDHPQRDEQDGRQYQLKPCVRDGVDGQADVHRLEDHQHRDDADDRTEQADRKPPVHEPCSVLHIG